MRRLEPRLVPGEAPSSGSIGSIVLSPEPLLCCDWGWRWLLPESEVALKS